MSYSALGYTTSITFPPPIGKQSISIPLEQIVKDATNVGVQQLQANMPAIMGPVFDEAENRVVNQLWPKIQPKLRSEIDRGVATAVKAGAIGGAAILLGIFMSAVWVRKGRR